MRALIGAAARAVVRALGDDEAAFGAVARHGPAPGRGLELVGAGGAAGQDVGEALDVGAGDDLLAAFVPLAQPIHALGTEDVDLPVQDAAAVGHLLLLVRELLDEVLELLVGERPQVGEGVHRRQFLSSDDEGNLSNVKLSLRLVRGAPGPCARRRAGRARWSPGRAPARCRGRSRPAWAARPSRRTAPTSPATRPRARTSSPCRRTRGGAPSAPGRA